MNAKLLAVVSLLIFNSTVFAVSQNMTVSGRLLKPDGTAMNSSSVTFDVKVVPPGGSCNFVYDEQVTVNLSASDGMFELALGTGTINYGSLVTSFDQSNSMPCQNGASYSPALGDTPSLQIKFQDNMETPTVWRTFTTSIPLRSVPHAMYAGKAEKLGSYTSSDFLLKPTATCSAGDFVSFDGTTTNCSAINSSNISGTFADAMISSLSVDKLINGTSKYFNYKPNNVACANGQVLTYSTSTSAWICGTPAVGAVSSVGVTAPIVNSGSTVAPVIGITQSNSSTSGYLSSTDWNTFNNKLSNNSELSGISAIAMTGIVQRTGSGTYNTLGVSSPLQISGGNIGIANISAGLITSGTLPVGVLPNSVVVANGNSLGAELSIGTNDSQTVSLRTAGLNRLVVDGVGTVSVGKTILMRSVANASTTVIDFSSGNLQWTSSSCQAFSLQNMKDGGSYTFAVKGATSGTCSFLAYSDAGASGLTVHMPQDHGPTVASTHTLYTFLVMGSDVYVSWMPGL